MKVSNVFDIFGAIIVLAALGLIIKNPQIVTTGGNQFNTALRTAVGG